MIGRYHKFWITCFWVVAGSILGMVPSLLKGQSTPLTDSIEFHARELVRNQDSMARERAFDYLNDHMGDFLQEYSDYRDSFPDMEGLAVLESGDLSLRVVTYQLYRDTSTYYYGGWIQSKLLDEPVFLTDDSPVWENENDLDYMVLGPDRWYGALYYEWKALSDSEGSVTILLFGLDNYRFFTKRKLLETLVIEDGQVRFGEPVIEMEEELPRDYWKMRFILDYSVQAPAIMRYDVDLERIIFDHLIFMPSDIPEQRIMRVPDGTYSGFEVVKEVPKLVFVEKMFFETMDEAPGGRSEPKVKRDLFGNPIDRD